MARYKALVYSLVIITPITVIMAILINNLTSKNSVQTKSVPMLASSRAAIIKYRATALEQDKMTGQKTPYEFEIRDIPMAASKNQSQ